jgi:cytochrome b6
LTRRLKSARARSLTDRLNAWWRERIDFEPLVALADAKTVPMHRHSWIYLLGGVALFLFAVQIGTGCLLMLYYQPTEATAHESVRRIMTEVPYGWLFRSLHVWGGHFFVASVVLHMITVLLTKAYRRPRELTWISGVLLLLLTLGLGFSGYLLPWNELSYYATLVGTQIAGSLPVVGDLIVRLLRGGEQVSGETITRFYAAHVVIVPLLLAVVTAIHVGLVQLQGMSLPAGMPRERVKDNQPFFSEFLLTDATLWLVLLGTLATLAVVLPAAWGVKADPLQPAPEGIKPEWYFLFLFQLLKHVPEYVGIALLVAGMLFLFVLPFLDRQAAHDRPSHGFTALYLVLIAAAIGLQIQAILTPSAEHAAEELTAATYHAVGNTVWLVLVWIVIAFLVYQLQKLRSHNRRLRLLRADEHSPPS